MVLTSVDLGSPTAWVLHHGEVLFHVVLELGCGVVLQVFEQVI